MLRLAFIDLGSRLVQYFAEVSRQMEPDIQAVFYCTKPKARSVARQLGFPTFPSRGDGLGEMEIPGSVQNEILNAKILAENPDRRKLEARLHRLYPSLKTFLEQQRIDAVFLWNGSGLVASIATSLAHHKGIKTLFGENGYFYNTLQLDPVGVNQASSITTKIGQAYQQQQLENSKLQELDAIIDTYQSGARFEPVTSGRRVRASMLARLQGELKNLRTSDFRWRRAINKAVPSEPRGLPEKYIFLPFQVVKDSQLLLYSPLVGNDMELFLASCREAARAVAGDHAIVVKLHPADVKNVDYSELMQRYPDVIFLKDYPANTLIKNASLVITINSTVGVEALIHYKPVITLGQNFYNVPEVVYHVENLSDLPHAIKSSLSSPPEKDKVRRLLYFLYHQYFAHGSWKDYSPQSIAAVASKMSFLLTSVD